MAFKTYITFEDGSYHCEHTAETDVSSTIMRLLRGPAAKMGMIKEFRIVDATDCTVFLAQDNKIIFPTKEDCDAALKAG